MLSLIIMVRGDSYVAFVLQMWLVLTGPRESFIGCNVYTCFHAHDFATPKWAGTATRESMVMSSHGQLRYRYHHLGSSHESGGHGVWCLCLVCTMILWSAAVRLVRVFWTRKAEPHPQSWHATITRALPTKDGSRNAALRLEKHSFDARNILNSLEFEKSSTRANSKFYAKHKGNPQCRYQHIIVWIIYWMKCKYFSRVNIYIHIHIDIYLSM